MATLTVWLQASGIPAAAPIPALDGRLRCELKGISLSVYPVVEGDLLDIDDSTQVTEAGRMLATLHETLAVCPLRMDGGGPTGHDQLIHNDFRSANVLHDGTRISAVLDLEEVTYGTRVADLAKATVLLGTRYRNWGPTSLDVREAFVAGASIPSRLCKLTVADGPRLLTVTGRSLELCTTVRRELSSRLERIPLRRIRRRADYWALRRIEEEHVKRQARRFRLSDLESQRVASWWLAEIDDLLGDHFERLFVGSDRPRRMPRIRPKVLFQLWCNTVGPGGRCWFGNRYVTIRRYTFQPRWRP